MLLWGCDPLLIHHSTGQVWVSVLALGPEAARIQLNFQESGSNPQGLLSVVHFVLLMWC